MRKITFPALGLIAFATAAGARAEPCADRETTMTEGLREADRSDTSRSHEVPKPAPDVRLAQAESGQIDRAAGAAGYGVGALRITDAFARATLPNAPVAGGFMNLTNDGPDDDRLVSVSTDAAGRTEMHRMAMDGDVMRMRPLDDGLTIPAGETVELRPGGSHIMLMDLKSPLAEGGTVNLTLTFEKAGEIRVPLAIGAPDARAGQDGHDAGAGHGAARQH